MKDTFYIIKASDTIYQVRLVNNKECISVAPSLEEALERILLLVDRYSTPENLYKQWMKSDLAPSKNAELERNIKLYNSRGMDYQEEIYGLFRPKLIKKAKKTINKVDIDLPEDNLVGVTSNKLIKPKKRIIFKSK